MTGNFVNWLTGKGKIALWLHDFSSISFLYRKNFHLLKKNSKLLRELKNLDSRQWYVKAFRITIPVCVCVWIDDRYSCGNGYTCRDTKGSFLTESDDICPCCCFGIFTLENSTYMFATLRGSVLPPNLYLWLAASGHSFSCHLCSHLFSMKNRSFPAHAYTLEGCTASGSDFSVCYVSMPWLSGLLFCPDGGLKPGCCN